MKEEQENSYGHVLKYISLFGGVQGLNLVISLVRNKIVAMLLGPQGMGLVSLFNTTVNFISQTTSLGLSFSAVRHVSELFDAGDEAAVAHFVKVVRLWSIITALVGMMVCVLAGPLLSSYTFSWGDHTLHFVLLAPAVGMMAVTGGEMAILKGGRRLKSLAMIQVVSVFAALIISLPLYYFFNQTGIVPVIVLMALVSMLLTIGYSYRFYPLSLRGADGVFAEGMGMVRLGVAFMLSGILASSAEMLIRSYLNVVDDLEVVGLYNVGYMLTMTYCGLVFTAMDTDYFPRLSAVGDDRPRLCLTVNRQIEVTLLIISPMLLMFMVAVPVLIPLLFTAEFLPAVGMTQVILLSMFFRAVYLPVAYIPLARGESWPYLFLETTSYVLMVLLVLGGYHYAGLLGTGVAIALANVLDILITGTFAFVRYHFRVSASVLRYLAVQFPLGLAAYLLNFLQCPLLYWGGGVLLSMVSLGYSLYVLRQKTSLWETLKSKVLKRRGFST